MRLINRVFAKFIRSFFLLKYYLKARFCHLRKATKLRRVLIFIPSYNAEKSIARAIQSALDQETTFDFGIVVGDDCSTDKTVSVVSDLIKKHPDIIELVNRAHNLGVPGNHYDLILSNIDTEFFCILDADDYYTDTTKLQKQVESLDANFWCSYSSHACLLRKDDSERSIPFNRQTGVHKDHFYSHTSAKLYRSTVVDFIRGKNPALIIDALLGRIASYLGHMYYIETKMSVYDYTGDGIYSSQPKEIQDKRNQLSAHILNFYTFGHHKIAPSVRDKNLIKNKPLLKSKAPGSIKEKTRK